MADLLRSNPIERDVEQAIIALKKGTHLLKYGRRGKPKFCPFRLSNDESILIWYSGKDEKQLKLSSVSKIIPGQRTAIFQRYPRPEKEYQSFSLLYPDRSLDLICKDKDEAEVWFVGLKALISRSNNNNRKWRLEPRSERVSTDTNSLFGNSVKPSPLGSPISNPEFLHKDYGDSQQTSESPEYPRNGLANFFSDSILYNAAASKGSVISSIASNPLGSFSSGGGVDNQNVRGSAVEAFRVSLSSAVSSSSHGSGRADFDALGDVYIWGEGIGDGFLGGGLNRVGSSTATNIDALLPKGLKPTVVLDVQNLACGARHAILVTKQGEVFSWGEESGGRLGHGVDTDVPQPKLIEALSGLNIELVACGEFHSCAVTISGDLYTWGDGTHNFGLLGHSSEVSHCIPKVIGQLDGMHVSSVSCGPWHTAVVTSSGKLFTFGDGTFGALGHGDCKSAKMPREVEALKGLRTVQAACGVWHSAAIVELPVSSPDSSFSSLGKVFTWGNGDKGRLGHGDRDSRLHPDCVDSLEESSFCQVACGHDITVVLSNYGHVYTMGSNAYGQLGNLDADGKFPTCVKGNLSNVFVEEIACGSYHVAVLTSQMEVYTWGKGANGRLGHGDINNRVCATLVESLKDKHVKSIICGSNFTAAICLHKWVSGADQAICSGCRQPFGFRRKRHNCYNCGLVFCKSCSSQKSIKACMAPNFNKPYRVCDECHAKLKKAMQNGTISQFRINENENMNQASDNISEKGNLERKPSGQFSRFSSVDSLKPSDRRSSKLNKGGSNNHFAPLFTASTPWSSLYSSKSTSCISGTSRKIYSASVPSSRITSRATSPVKRSKSPNSMFLPNGGDTARPSIPFDGQNIIDCESSKIIARLRSQVGDLTRKTQILEIELDKTTRQLQEAKAKSGEETLKCNAAKEVIKSLTAQLKDMAQRTDGCKIDGYAALSNISSTSNNYDSPNENDVSNPSDSQAHGSDECNPNTSCNGSQTSAEISAMEHVEQVEPGVYITVSSFPGGEKYLKRVRFSRKRFGEHQAENWWSENRLRLQEKYGILTSEKNQ